MSKLEGGVWVDTNQGTASPTRADYMNGKVTFAQYYGAVARTAGVNLAGHPIMERVKRSTDEHLNDVPLEIWDRMGRSFYHSIQRALRAHSDDWSLAGSVCVLKQAARDAQGEPL